MGSIKYRAAFHGPIEWHGDSMAHQITYLSLLFLAIHGTPRP
jgi:hypothetical protein